jgi:hypothetical protein
MAKPYELTEPTPQIHLNRLEPAGFTVPPGWYGFVAAASSGIINRALVSSVPKGMAALKALGEPDPQSRSQEFEGRRMVRINGGFLILNFMKYRDRDSTNAERQRRFRDRQQKGATVPSGRRGDRRQTEKERMRMRAQVGLYIPPDPPEK